ncbi:curli-like amyloid fiber formation chaperone CsgH [Candidatus Viadribacter manganicus]|uniref:CsgH-like domain-containing protein n=1 Tax=Candidatus Viadribacter manganicus TaxID=1759059 RepID=A0A1B1ADW3_9PROT|nr:curli-like amyloid fiber formation chaperone CsgH [Candidatus Viadribacter manganicus]ANP44743.1 hypothetical protein ATE48_01795 [Candidatus Viadribacter manganicus]
MSKKSLSLIALAALLSACSASAQNVASAEQISEPALLSAAPSASFAEPASDAPAPYAEAAYEDAAITCDVRSRRTANGVVIQARAFADRDVDGEYDLRIVKTGGGGSAEISQSGALVLEAGMAATLGENEISMERGSRVRAVLTLRDETGELCQRTFRL